MGVSVVHRHLDLHLRQQLLKGGKKEGKHTQSEGGQERRRMEGIHSVKGRAREDEGLCVRERERERERKRAREIEKEKECEREREV